MLSPANKKVQNCFHTSVMKNISDFLQAGTVSCTQRMALVDAAVLCCLVAMFGNTCEPDVVQGLDLHLFVFSLERNMKRMWLPPCVLMWKSSESVIRCSLFKVFLSFYVTCDNYTPAVPSIQSEKLMLPSFKKRRLHSCCLQKITLKGHFTGKTHTSTFLFF